VALHGSPDALAPEMFSDRIATGAIGANLDVGILCESPLAAAVTHLEENLLKRTLAQTNWNKSRSARMLGLSRQGLIKKIKRYGIVKNETPR
jgi:DNA-binding NtrC family response regulator